MKIEFKYVLLASAIDGISRYLHQPHVDRSPKMVSACRFAIGTEKMRWIRPLLFHQYNIFYTSEADLTWRMANWTLRKYYSQCHNHSAVLRVVWYLKRTMRPEIRETEVSLPDWGEIEWRWNCFAFNWCLNSLAVLSFPLLTVWTFCRENKSVLLSAFSEVTIRGC